MNKLISPYRIVFLIIAIAIVLSIYGGALFDLQMRSDVEQVDETMATTSTTFRTVAARGTIMDRNGEVLAYDDVTYNIFISRSVLLEMEDPNAALLTILNTAIEADVEYTDTLPISYTSPFTYVDDMTSAQESRLESYIEYFDDLESSISASDLMVWLMEHYDIDYTVGFDNARRIAGVRYELEIRAISNISDYFFAEDVDVEFITKLLEQDLPCIEVETTTERKYNTKYAAQILGYTGLMYAEEYEKTYKALNYPLDATVGKDGVELAFESYLHPTSGYVTITKNTYGEVVGVTEESAAVGGSNIYLTLDIGMQGVAEEALEATINDINSTRKPDEQLASGGAVVALDVNTGKTLVAANYPSYDPATFYENYTELAEDTNSPLLNRATYGVYSPGSTFKMITSYAGLSAQKIGRWTPVTDKGIYEAYEDFQPTCWIYPDNHGTVDVVGALENSCNYFFYWLSDILGIQVIADTATAFGLGEKTGIETGEASGHVATPEYKQEAVNEGWWAADTLQAAIGQGHNMFTPIQIANYVATIANDGTVYKTTLLDKVVNYDYTETLYTSSPEILKTVEDPEGYLSILREGMRAVVNTGTAAEVLSDYSIPVAAKTGTVQSDSAEMNTGVFVCFAPANDPEIAIAVVVENGGSGSDIINVAKEIMSYYFSASDFTLIEVENELSQ